MLEDRVLALWTAAVWGLLGVAHAEDGDAVADREPAEEIVVYDDPFARWDGTRWLVRTQMGLPAPYVLYAQLNHEIEVVAIDLAFVMACEKTWRRGKARYEVDCALEDVALQAATWRPTEQEHAPAILDEIDARLTGTKLQLRVADDGRVVGIDLFGMPEDNDREKAMMEQCRQLLRRAIAGFHMRLPPRSEIRRGQWVEYDSPLFEVPYIAFDRNRGAKTDASQRTRVAFNTLGGSALIHQLDLYKGVHVVQTKGKGTVVLSSAAEDEDSYLKLKFDGVAVYDRDTGIMSERVWSIAGKTTASGFFGDRSPSTYFQVGQFVLLDADTKPDVGRTGMVERPGAPAGRYPAWVALDISK